MRRFAVSLSGTAIFLAIGATAVARDAVFDPNQLPAVQGTVSQYILDSDGDVAGLMLDGGTEVQANTRDTSELVLVARPGDHVTVHGLKAHAEPMMLAMSITNDATHAMLLTRSHSRSHDRDAPIEAAGTIKAQLHDSEGEVDGILLADGTVVNLPLSDIERRGQQLAVGQTIYASGSGTSNLLGRVIAARVLGPSKAAATQVASPAVDEEHEGRHHGRGGGHHRHHDSDDGNPA